MKTAAIVGLLAVLSSAAAAQGADASPRQIRLTGRVASIRTTRPVAQADVRFFFVDSMHADKSAPGGLGELFVDSTRSRVGVTDSAGAFVVRGIPSGHYFMQVRRIGFQPIEALMTVDTLALDIELAMTQVDAILPEVRINASATNRVTDRLDRVGYSDRKKFGNGSIFIERGDILRQHPTRASELLEKYGLTPDTFVMIDGMDSDWETLTDYPVDLIIGIEIYRHRNSLPAQYDRTRAGALTFGPGGSGGRDQPTVLLWTYVP